MAYIVKKSVAKTKDDNTDASKKSNPFRKPVKSVSMISDADPDPLDAERIYLDGCASDSMLLLTDQSHFDNLSR